VPIITVELALVALFSFTLVAPLAVPLWVPAIIIMLMVGLVALLRRVSDRHRTGLGAGLAVLRMHSRGRLITFALAWRCAPRCCGNWLMLHAIGVQCLDLRLDGAADRPCSPSATADRHRVPAGCATVLILGAHGVAATAGRRAFW